MSFQPILPSTGIVGWNFLQSTYDRQFEVFSKSPTLQRESDYFVENIGKVQSVDDLLNDRQLLAVALGAFGLDDQIDSRGLLKKVLQDGTQADDALANRLGDDRYVKFSEAFGFGPGETVKTNDAQAMADLMYTNKVQTFEAAVGEQDHSMRVAMFAQRELEVLASDGTSTDTKWFNVMGQPALREMMETVLGLPSSSFSQIDIDQQLSTLKERSRSVLGSEDLSVLSDPDKMKDLVTTYLARAELAQFNAGYSSTSTALMLLQG